MGDMRRQLRDNLLAIISLAVAFSALGYNTWRNERTERNRNVRVAGIEILKEIASLQQVMFYAHYVQGDPRGELRMGWADVSTLNDFAVVMPESVAREARELQAAWEQEAGALAEQDAAFARVDRAVDELRQATIAALRALR
jgi:poly(3-hydroxybutyrate) depolymerase